MNKVSVPQETGEISIQVGVSDPLTYTVTQGHISVSDDDLQTVLVYVPGSKEVRGNSTAKGDK